MIRPFRHDEGEPAEIMLWSGTLTDIPAGWVLCDGNNGTPDFRSKFMRGNSSMGTSVGAGGGTNSQTLSESNLPSHTHGGSTSGAGSHSHSFTVGGVCNTDSFEMTSPESGSDTANTGDSGSHTHSLSIGSTGSGSSFDNRPAYHELAFIMKA